MTHPIFFPRRRFGVLSWSRSEWRFHLAGAKDQALLFGFSAVAIWLVNCDPPWGPRAPLAGLIGQVFWIRETWTSRKWGMFLLSLWFTAAWLRGGWATVFGG